MPVVVMIVLIVQHGITPGNYRRLRYDEKTIPDKITPGSYKSINAVFGRLIGEQIRYRR